MNRSEHELLKKCSLEIMDEIHRICTSHGIDYYIIGGTALGAIRHDGFIPWDTDIDIAMKRTDYERFADICPGELKPGFRFADYSTQKQWYKPNAVVLKEGTEITWSKECYRHRRSMPIYVDIMPLDYVPAEKALQEKQAAQIRRKRRYQKYRDYICYKENSGLVCAVKYAFSLLLKVESNYRFNKSLDDIMKRCRTSCGTICSMGSHYSYKKQCMDEAIYGTPKLYGFEGREYLGPEKMHDYLQKLFGDYMKLPPEENRDEQMKKISTVRESV